MMSRGGLLAGTAMTPPGADDPDKMATIESDGDGPDSETPEETDAEQSNVTPEEQAQFDDFVKDGLALIYGGGKVNQNILSMLDDDPKDLLEIFGDAPELKDFSPITALAATTVLIVTELLRKAGDKRPEDAVIMHGGKELLQDLAHVADVAKIHTFTQDELNRAFYLGMDLFRETASQEGLIDTKGLAEEFGQIKAADEAGAFGGVQGAAEPPLAPDQGGGMTPAVQP